VINAKRGALMIQIVSHLQSAAALLAQEFVVENVIYTMALPLLQGARMTEMKEHIAN
jgi:hypothetical protein